MLFVADSIHLVQEYHAGKALEGFRNIKIKGQVIRTAKYADDLVLLAKKEAVLYGMTERLNETGTCYGMEMKEGKTKVMRISWHSPLIQIMKTKSSHRMCNISTT
jgi:hypothetical protein